ncbi:MAG: DsbA family protein [Patescibacteria group bacterium]
MEGETTPEKKKRDFLLPGSVLVAALFISISLVWSTGKKAVDKNLSADLSGKVQDELTSPVAVSIRPVDDSDHFWGNKNAPVKLIEYSDLECPFCKDFHPTLKKVVEDYGGEIVWVYRHFPIDFRHPKARKEAEATECANELGGNDKFWAYIEKLYEITPSNNGLDLAELPKIAVAVGLDKSKFETCLTSGKYAKRVDDDVLDAANAKAGGTPYAIVIAENGKKYAIPGALPYDDPDPNQLTVKRILDEVLQ